MSEPVAPIICPHCSATINAKFCAECGEKRPSTLRWASSIDAIFEAALNFHSPFFKALIGVIWQPRQLIFAYWQGERKYLIHPVKLCFWLTTLLFGAILAFDLEKRVVYGAEAGQSQLKLLLSISQYLLFLYLVPVGALFARWCESQRSALEGYIALLYTFCGIALLKIITLPLVMVEGDWLFWLHRSITPMWLAWVLATFLPKPWFKRAMKALGIIAAYYALTVFGNVLIVTLFASP